MLKEQEELAHTTNGKLLLKAVGVGILRSHGLWIDRLYADLAVASAVFVGSQKQV